MWHVEPLVKTRFLCFCLLLSGYQPGVFDVSDSTKNMAGERHEQLQYESHGCPFPIDWLII